MLALDAILLKVTEECAEVSTEATLLAKVALKTTRFGEDSCHPRDPERRSNDQLMHTYLANLATEVHDLQAIAFLYFCTQYQFTAREGELDAMVKKWFHTAELRHEAIRKLMKYDRLLGVTQERGSINAEERVKVSNAIDHVSNYLKGYPA